MSTEFNKPSIEATTIFLQFATSVVLHGQCRVSIANSISKLTEILFSTPEIYVHFFDCQYILHVSRIRVNILLEDV